MWAKASSDDQDHNVQAHFLLGMDLHMWQLLSHNVAFWFICFFKDE